MIRSSLIINVLAVCGAVLLFVSARDSASRNPPSAGAPAAWSCAGTAAVTDPPAPGTRSLGRLQIPFVANQGQIDDVVAFYTRTRDGTAFVTYDGEVIYSLPKLANEPGVERMVLKETFAGGRAAHVRGCSPAVTRVNHFVGNDPSQWKRDIPTYECVELGPVREGIDLTLRARGNNVEKLFCVHPGAKPEDISVRLSGATGLRVNAAGELEVDTELGVVAFTKPVAYQEGNGEQEFVAVSYAVRGSEYGFTVGAYDLQRTLIIDPLLASTYLGGGGGDGLYEIPTARDADGNVYIAGRTNSADFPTTPGVVQGEPQGGQDVFVAKLTGDLTTLLAATYLGGSAHDGEWPGVGLTLDASGNVYVTGQTASTDFPWVPGAYDPDHNGNYDVFVSKLDGDLANLLASTFLGGTAKDEAHCIIVSEDEYVYVVGATASVTTFPIQPGAYQDTHHGGGNEVFAAKFDASLGTLVASTFLGGVGYDFAEVIALNDDGNLYLTGWTSSPGFPTSPGAYAREHSGGVYDAFVSALSPGLDALPASTLIGGSAWDFGYALTLDNAGNVYISGHTASGSPTSGFPTTPGAYDDEYSGEGGPGVGDDAFVSKFDSALTTLVASTFLGDANWENGTALCVDDYGYVYVAGSTSSPHFPTTPGAYEREYHGGSNQSVADAFVSRLDGALTTLSASTFVAGISNDCLGSMFLDSGWRVCLGGSTGSDDFPTTPGAYDQDFNGGTSYHDGRPWGGDAFITILDRMLTACYGDLDGDGIVGLADLARLLSRYGTTSGAVYADGDLDGDGSVDLSDLAALLAVYGTTCE